MKFTAIILAAGSGKRTGLKYNKVLYEIKGKKVIDYSIDFFRKYTYITEIILVVSKDDYLYFSKEFETKVDKVVIGGLERQESVYNALNEATYEYVLIHDGARPFIPSNSMDEIYRNINDMKSITLAVPVKDTIQRVIGNRVIETFNRNEIYAVQTPQVFKTDLILDAHKKAKESDFIGTDDTMLIQKFMDQETHIIIGDYRNIKLTTLDDIKLLEVILWFVLDTVQIFIG